MPKLLLDSNALLWVLSDLVNAVGFIEVPLRTEHVEVSRSFLNYNSGDPVDRMIRAQALHENAVLLTSDQKLLAMNRDWIVDAQL
jgi:PIN domain nuclease of toxin-antitoxin system